MTPTNAELVARARALDAAATPGPWAIEGHGIMNATRSYTVVLFGESDQDDGDAAFIAAARDLLPLLADRLEAAEGAGGVEGT